MYMSPLGSSNERAFGMDLSSLIEKTGINFVPSNDHSCTMPSLVPTEIRVSSSVKVSSAMHVISAPFPTLRSSMSVKDA